MGWYVWGHSVIESTDWTLFLHCIKSCSLHILSQYILVDTSNWTCLEPHQEAAVIWLCSLCLFHLCVDFCLPGLPHSQFVSHLTLLFFLFCLPVSLHFLLFIITLRTFGWPEPLKLPHFHQPAGAGLGLLLRWNCWLVQGLNPRPLVSAALYLGYMLEIRMCSWLCDEL